MKRQIILYSALMGLIIACSPKSTTSATTKPATTTPVVEKPVTEAPKSSDMVNAGKLVYEAKCGRCHGLKTTTHYTQERWKNILVYMIPKANLNEDEARQVTAYVNANAKP